ncbi:WD40-repeat-containing domain protein [Lipomyces oligophaga]|uniref:WD40-repeat-containing domain protein n=1 Tax=Lipomyces oligophaga TaxID=45792 RepID=UPI0034CD74F7
MPFPVHPKSTALQDHLGAVHIVKYNTTGQYILSGGFDKQIRLWNPNTSRLVKTYSGHGYEVLDIAVSFDNSKFVSCGGDRTIYVWDVTTGTTVRRFSGHIARVNSVDFNFDASVVASASFDSSVRLWDLRAPSAKPIQILDDAKDSVSTVQITNTQIITGSVDEYVRVYDLRMGELQEDYIGHPVTSVRDSTDGAYFLVSSLDNTIRLIDKSNGSLLQSFTGHKNAEYRIRSCFGDNDIYAISGSEDSIIYVWEVLSGRIVHELKGGNSDAVVTCIDYNPKKAQMVSGTTDGKIQVWDTD